MAEPKITRRQVLKGAAAAGALGALGAPAAVLAQEGDGKTVRWDLVNVLTGCATAGGRASATAADGAKITVRGSGTFPAIRNRCSEDVTGGGTWEITPGTADCFSGSGSFNAKELLIWTPAPGDFPLPCDDIGPIRATSAGYAKLRVKYSNGETGVLTISCHLAGTPDCVFEGITATMRFEDFTHPEAPVPGQEGNRTLFHILR